MRWFKPLPCRLAHSLPEASEHRRAGVAGLVVGLLLAFLLQVLDRRIKDEAELELTIGAPVLARIPRVGRQWQRRRHGSGEGVVFATPGTLLLEAFRSLRSNLQFFEVGKPIKTIMITSALPKEGKSVTTVNLALSLALSGSRVFIVEADLRRPRLHRYLGVSPELGLSNYLAARRNSPRSPRRSNPRASSPPAPNTPRATTLAAITRLPPTTSPAYPPARCPPIPLNCWARLR